MAGPNQPDTRILMGRIGAAHGIKGEVRITAFTEDPLAIADYDPLQTDRKGLSVSIAKARVAKNVVIATLKGVTDRNEAEKLNGVSLYVNREQLEAPDEDEFYHADLIGLEVRHGDGTVLGTISTIENFGSDDLLDVRLAGTRKSVYLPFTKAVVPELHISEGYVVAVPPEGWLEDAPRDPEDRDPDEAQ
ncbi:ribosome maturation factor RimM [Pelagibacterium sp. 26DY04]|uniref:ribosome maturation factor RimM n=1 Tax=Pelagibacterium sp. 26DY04 TaxID=2967130 RepID=UPI00281689F0|nr:ribosome maturation factor RimM [Pelagibacterium sp. 26DY04]WMT86944.1 ribosome maturation factor RimM [Pelagibacterium sp. 26DY04]